MFEPLVKVESLGLYSQKHIFELAGPILKPVTLLPRY